MNRELMALLWSYLYVGVVVATGEATSRLGMSKEVARKIIHVGVGLWIFGTQALFTDPFLAVIPPLTAAAVNYVIHKKNLLQAVKAEPDNLGTVYFPISFAILILLAWDVPGAVAGGVMAMTIGDAMASLVGQRWGRRRYSTVGGQVKSLQGSLAMLLSTFVAVLLTLGIADSMTGVARLSGWFLPALAALAAVVATGAEALGVKGRDNLWVPLSTGAAIYLGFKVLPVGAVITLGIGAVLAFAIGAAAWLRGSLTPSGVLGAVVTGTLVFGLGGWAAGLGLVGFFLSSSALSRRFRERKAAVEAGYAKVGARDLGQALANGGVAALACVAYAATGSAAWLGGALGALAAANADTWATEVGVLSRRAPRLITTLQAVPPGTSGAVSGLGTLAALGGAGFVAVVAAAADSRWLAAVPMLALAGLAGSLLDSVLGATVQGQFWCPACGKATERRVHHCGGRTELRRGWGWFGNDLVNLLATVTGAVVGLWVG